MAPSEELERSAPWAAGGRSMTLDAGWHAAVADEELRRQFIEPDFAADDWNPITVPSHWRTQPGLAGVTGSVLHRTAFELDPITDAPGARTWLALDGIFYTSDVWLDGAYLGDTEGSFFPHVFEITDLCLQRDDHLLALDVACRAEEDRAHKRNLTGAFQRPDPDGPDLEPGGIWRPVRIERSGPVRISHLRTLCRDATGETATVFVRAVLDAPDGQGVEVITTLVPLGADDAGTSSGVEHRQSLTLAQGENRLEWTVTVPEPRRWWPHALGDPDRYELTVAVHLDDEPERGASDVRRRAIGLRTVAMADWIFRVNGERLFLKGTSHGLVDADLAGAPAEAFARDVELAVEANLDLLRVRGHVSRPELYEAADAAGLLLWQDMPLQWGYHRSVRRQARRQARELVDLLGHHPSIALWCGHDVPVAIDPGPDACATRRTRATLTARLTAAQELPTWNKTVLDRAIRSVLEKCDGTRPVVAHSGVLPHPPTFSGTDSHLAFGWYHGDERDLARTLRSWPRLARFVTGYGARSVPVDATFLDPDVWPDLDWDRLRRERGFEPRPFAEHVPPAAFATFAEWVTATQTYQALLVRRQIEALRRIKYRPTGGFVHSSLADPRDAISASVLDHDRRPKSAHDALRTACAPVIVVADQLPRSLTPGTHLTVAVHVINDRHIALDDMIVEAYLHKGEATSAEQRWRWHGEVPEDTCTLVGRPRLVVPSGPGELSLDLVLRGPDHVLATNRYTSAVDGPEAGAPDAGIAGGDDPVRWPG